MLQGTPVKHTEARNTKQLTQAGSVDEGRARALTAYQPNAIACTVYTAKQNLSDLPSTSRILDTMPGQMRSRGDCLLLPFTGRLLIVCLLQFMRRLCFAPSQQKRQPSTVLGAVQKRRGGRYIAPWASSIRPPSASWCMGRARPHV